MSVRLTGVENALSVSLWDGVVELFSQAWQLTVTAWRQIGLAWVIFALGIAVATGATAGLSAIGYNALGIFLAVLITLSAGLWFGMTLLRVLHAAMTNKTMTLAATQYDAAPTMLRLAGSTIGLAAITLGGAILLVVPGLIWRVMYFGAPLAVVLDKKTVGASFGWSRELTKGRKLNIAVLLSMAMLFWSAIYYGIQLLALLLGVFLDSSLASVVVAGVSGAAMLFFTPITLSIVLMTYEGLKKR